MSRLRPWLLLARVYRLDFHRYRDVEVDPRFDLHVPSPAELDSAIERFPEQLNSKDVDAARARGDICMAAFDRCNGNRMVGFAWATTTTAPHDDGLWVAVDFPAIYGYKSFVDPDYRGRGLNVAMIVERDRVARRHGFGACVAFVETHNYASVQSNIHLGSDRVGYAGYARVFGRVVPFRSPRARQATLRFYRREG